MLSKAQFFVVNAEDYSVYSESFKKYDYLREEYKIEKEVFDKMLHYITRNVTYYAMEHEKKEHAYISAIFRAIEEGYGDLRNSDLSDSEKSLIAHDRIVLHTKYDEGIICKDPATNSQKYCLEKARKFSYSPYGILVEGMGVCQGYAIAYALVMTYLGVDCEYVESHELEHAWNVISIDGSKYIVDVTHDDIIPDRLGKASHLNFLVSSKKYYDLDVTHQFPNFDMSLKDSKFDNAFWRNIDSAFYFTNGSIYYMDDEKSSINQYKDGKIFEIKKLSDTWRSGPTSHWKDKFFSLSVDGDKFYYNDSKNIYEFDPIKQSSKKVYSPNLNLSKYETIYGFYAADGQFYFSVLYKEKSRPEFRRDMIQNPDLSVFFKDFPKENHPSHEAVKFCVENGLLGEAEKRKLKLEMPVSRAQIVTMLWRMMGSPAPTRSFDFNDLKADWYKNPIAWAVENRIVSGVGNGYFAPDKKISKQDVIVILHHFEEFLKNSDLKFKKEQNSADENKYVLVLKKGNSWSVTQSSNAMGKGDRIRQSTLSHYKDVEEIGDWAYESLVWAHDSDLLEIKKGLKSLNFNPKSDVSREQIAIFLKNFILMKR